MRPTKLPTSCAPTRLLRKAWISLRSAADDATEPEGASTRKVFFPSSIGLSFLVPVACDDTEVVVRWGDHLPDDADELGENEGEEKKEAPETWRRAQRESVVKVSAQASTGTFRQEVPDSDGLWLAVSVRVVTAADLVPEGTRSVSVFLANH